MCLLAQLLYVSSSYNPYFAPDDFASVTILTNMVPICLSNTRSLSQDNLMGTSDFVIVVDTDQNGSG